MLSNFGHNKTSKIYVNFRSFVQNVGVIFFYSIVLISLGCKLLTNFVCFEIQVFK
jgi:hypothetical protein